MPSLAARTPISTKRSCGSEGIGSVGGTGGAAGGAGGGGRGGATAGVGGGGAAGTGGGGGSAVTLKPTPVTGATTVTDGSAMGGTSVGLTGTGQGARSPALPAASKLAIRYASTSKWARSASRSTTRPARKVNVHSSGALTDSFLHAIIELAIPANATLTISRATNDVAVNIDRIIVGDGDLGLPPDIWNLPPLPVAAGPYAADWKAMSRLLRRAGVVARREVRRVGALGSAVHARAGRLVCATACIRRAARTINYHVNHFGHPVRIRLQGHLP